MAKPEPGKSLQRAGAGLVGSYHALPYGLRHEEVDGMKRLTAIQAIHEYCVEDCCGGNRKGPGLCSDEKCRFFPYRTGHNLYYKSSNKPIQPRERESGRFRPSNHGRKAILQTVTEGKKRIRVIVEDVR